MLTRVLIPWGGIILLAAVLGFSVREAAAQPLGAQYNDCLANVKVLSDKARAIDLERNQLFAALRQYREAANKANQLVKTKMAERDRYVQSRDASYNKLMSLGGALASVQAACDAGGAEACRRLPELTTQYRETNGSLIVAERDIATANESVRSYQGEAEFYINRALSTENAIRALDARDPSGQLRAERTRCETLRAQLQGTRAGGATAGGTRPPAPGGGSMPGGTGDTGSIELGGVKAPPSKP